MKIYSKIKKNYPDVVLFFQMGDFYELFYEDAILAAQVLGLTLTSRDADKKIEMAGFPHHQLHKSLTKMSEAGHRIEVVTEENLDKFLEI